MPRNRFETILRFIHFSDEERRPNDILKKVHNLVCLLNEKFEYYNSPEEAVVIDKTMVPFRGRLKFRQYLPCKSHKYGVKLYKACGADGYTYRVKIYSGKDENRTNSMRHSNMVVLSLLEHYLNEGMTLVVDNFYTNIEIATELLKSNTHLVGTMRMAVKNVPKSKLKPKLKKGEVIGLENDDGIVVGTWKDKRDVRFITTKHTLEMVNTGKKNRKGEFVYKPAAIVYYNKRKQGVDHSDQMTSYFSPLRKTIRLFRKVGFLLLLGTAVVNSWLVFKKLTGSKISISSFREVLIDGLIGCSKEITDKARHSLRKTEQKNKKKHSVPRRCIHCYAKLAQTWPKRRTKKMSQGSHKVYDMPRPTIYVSRLF